MKKVVINDVFNKQYLNVNSTGKITNRVRSRLYAAMDKLIISLWSLRDVKVEIHDTIKKTD